MKSTTRAFHVCVGLLSAAAVTAQAQDIEHAAYIFNEIHHAMRQFGSTLDHNGMAAFLATVPAATILYHGTGSSDHVDGPEWLSFEPEHALLFADDQPFPAEDGSIRSESVAALSVQNQQVPVMESPSLGATAWAGHLHTFRTKHSLRLLYVNGQSAAKSTLGTLDLQDKVLLRDYKDTPLSSQNIPADLPLNDGRRAQNLCKLANEAWHGRIDGIIRMEGGFEIILCNFTRHLEAMSIIQTKPSERRRTSVDMDYMFEYVMATGRRYDGIGGHRVKLDYDDYVSLFDFPGAVVFPADGQPRVNSSSSELPRPQEAITRMVLRNHSTETFDWQSVTDMIVARYARTIDSLASAVPADLSMLLTKVDRALAPFVDFSRRDPLVEVARCVEDAMPYGHGRSHSLAARAIMSVARQICRTFVTAIDLDTVEDIVSHFQPLKEYLAWSEWKKCRQCGVHELCFAPFCPFGSLSDFEQPKCVANFSAIHMGYWQ